MEKSQSVQDLMVLTHVEPSDLIPDSFNSPTHECNDNNELKTCPSAPARSPSQSIFNTTGVSTPVPSQSVGM